MAQNGQKDPVQPVGATGGATQTQQTQQTTAAAPQQGARQTAPQQDAQQAPQDAPVAQNEGLDLTDDAQRELEEKKHEEERELQRKIDELMAQIEDTKGQLQQAEAAKDKPKIAALTDQLHLQESQLGELLDQPAVSGAGHDQHPAGAGGLPNLIPAPAGGGMPMGGGGFNPYTFGAGNAGGQGGGRLSQGNFAPAANPNVQIPDFGRNANKQQIGQMLDSASEKYGIPPNILKAVAWQESGWNQNALSFDGHHGKGVMQIDDRFHEFARTDAVFDPAKNIDYGAKYLSDLYAKTGSWSAALKRYNGGDAYPPKVLALAERQPWQQHTGNA